MVVVTEEDLQKQKMQKIDTKPSTGGQTYTNITSNNTYQLKMVVFIK